MSYCDLIVLFLSETYLIRQGWITFNFSFFQWVVNTLTIFCMWFTQLMIWTFFLLPHFFLILISMLLQQVFCFVSGGEGGASTIYDTSSASSEELHTTVQSDKLVYLGHVSLWLGDMICTSLISMLEIDWRYVVNYKLTSHKKSRKLEEWLYIKDVKVWDKTVFCSTFITSAQVSDKELSMFMKTSRIQLNGAWFLIL